MNDSLNEIGLAFMKAIYTANPLGRLSSQEQSFIERNYQKHACHIPRDLFLKVLDWASKQKRYEEVLLDANPFFAFLKSWNKISRDWQQSVNTPRPEPFKSDAPEVYSEADKNSLRAWYLQYEERPGKEMMEKIDWLGSKEHLELKRRRPDLTDANRDEALQRDLKKLGLPADFLEKVKSGAAGVGDLVRAVK